MDAKFEQLLNDLRVDIPSTLARLSNNAKLLERVMLKFAGDNSFPSLEQSVAQWDAQTAEIAAHTMKGVSGNLGLMTLCDSCDRFVGYIRNNDKDAAVQEYASIEAEYKRIKNLMDAYIG